MTKLRTWRPKKADLLLVVGSGLLVSQALNNFTTGTPADAVLVAAGGGFLLTWAGVRWDTRG